jgi:hypothetical protein
MLLECMLDTQERWQSGRMYLTRNQAYRKVPWVRIPPSPPSTSPCNSPSRLARRSEPRIMRGFLGSNSPLAAPEIVLIFRINCPLHWPEFFDGSSRVVRDVAQ